MDEKAIVEKIKALRKNRQITLKDLANRTGLTEGYLSKIENAQNAPPFSTLSKIAECLDIDISFLLIPDNGSDGENPNIVVVNKEEIEDGRYSGSPHKKRVHGYQFEALASKKQGKNMEPYILVPDFEPGESLQHDGEEFFYVLEGMIEFLYGTEKYILSRGDCVYFESHIPHNGRSLGEDKAKVLIIMHRYKRV
jgi:transcriptional regulator with XRE-family HTH domain